MRLIPTQVRTFEELNLPAILHKLIDVSQGFVLITGPSSHGKSTTLAAMIDEITINVATTLLPSKIRLNIYSNPQNR